MYIQSDMIKNIYIEKKNYTYIETYYVLDMYYIF